MNNLWECIPIILEWTKFLDILLNSWYNRLYFLTILICFMYDNTWNEYLIIYNTLLDIIIYEVQRIEQVTLLVDIAS